MAALVTSFTKLGALNEKTQKQRELTVYQIVGFTDPKTGNDLEVSSKSANTILSAVALVADALEVEVSELSEKALSKAVLGEIPGLGAHLNKIGETFRNFVDALQEQVDENESETGSKMSPDKALASLLASGFTFDQISAGISADQLTTLINENYNSALAILKEKATSNGLTPDGKVKMKAPKKPKTEKKEETPATQE